MMDGFEKLIEGLHKSYYTQLLQFLCELVALIACFRYWYKNKIGKIFSIYIAIDFVLLLTWLYILNWRPLANTYINLFGMYANYTITIIEVLVYFYFFQHLFDKNIKGFLIIVKRVFLILAILSLIITTAFYPSSRWSFDMLSVFGFLLMAIVCLIYYFDLFRKPPIHDLFAKPTFWIVTGIFIFSLISVPYYSIQEYLLLSKNIKIWDSVSIFFYIPLSVNYLFLTRASICKNKGIV